MKRRYITFLLGIFVGIIIASVTVYAASTINSNSVSYDNTTSKLTSTNVKTAIDELYSIQNSGTAKAGDILSGKTAFSGGKLITGTYTIPGLTYETLYDFGASEETANSATATYTLTKNCKYVFISIATTYWAGTSVTTSFDNKRIANLGSGNMGVAHNLFIYLDVTSGSTVTMSRTNCYNVTKIICANY